ncbi:sulfite exporter TauE/SafE family protein [Fulvimarina sp. 2208YS6-2-32]|uniref:Probable membrane transporter protein n=1 Tax=Fulvimarina uroteuthidis TaxID=3098149 RepID=A0ABU5I3F1_9HYPH|nr:sulfite exporter TauE/SafE family protein [Fulvimarina sp. 2208YS6-2-32]MDY8109873.1 sulfite exporter TauE/SafE family protein [Fulvimarina sp. 2208YS6-2-32]
MIDAFDYQSLAAIVGALALAAALAGFLAGLFGIGGGAIYVPVLYQTYQWLAIPETVAMHVAVGTSIAIIVPTSVRSLAAHLSRDAVDRTLLKEWLVAVPAGSIAGAVLAASASSVTLRGIFAVLAFVIALKLLFGRIEWTIGKALPGLAGRSLAGVLIGFLSALIGIGGGVLNNTFMTLYGRPMIQAVATSAGVGALIAIPGVLTYVYGGWGEPDLPPYSLGFVSLATVALIAPVSLVAVPLGASLAHRLSRRKLEVGFGLFLLVVAARFAISLV